MGGGNTLTLCGDLFGNKDPEDKITLDNNATLNLNDHALSKSVELFDLLGGAAAIGNGTIGASVTVNEGMSAHFTDNTYIKGVTIAAGTTTVNALDTATPGRGIERVRWLDCRNGQAIKPGGRAED